MHSSLKAHLFILAANVIYGINYSIGKIVLQSMDPFGIVVIRVAISMLLFLLIHNIFIKEKIDRKDHTRLITAALFGVAINQLMFFKGLSLTSEMHSALIMITTPIIVLVMGWILLRSSITWLHIAGIIIGGTGVALLIISGAGGKEARSDPFGDLFIMINATSYAIFLVITKPLMTKYSPFTITKWIFIYGLAFVIPFGISDLAQTDWQHLTTITWLSLGYVVIGATFFAYLFNVLGLNYGNPALVSIYIYTQPVIASLIALISGTDTISTEKIISALLVFAGVALVSFTGKTVIQQQSA